MKITVPTKWSELNDWQRQEIAYLYLNSTEYNFESQFLKMIRVLFQGERGFFGKVRVARVFSQVPISTLVEYGKFLQEKPDLQEFPKIKNLEAPGPRLNDTIIKQFSVADAIFYNWRKTEDELYLRRLVASLYTFGGEFNVLYLPKVAKITDKIPLKKMYQIGMTYIGIRFAILNRYPIVFPKPKSKEDQEFTPQFHKKSYTPFSKMITTMAMDERQPLGILKECNNTLLYDFLYILTESMLRVEREQKAIKNAK
ncbi:hypothetical protein [Tenacibaculum maritimum]|uniref:hypothetical protein n=1 Tax=Tenacibaculum maritimum TaxID=107401 RepID=UPI0012E40003|nr:hypothetical protein [Tenacibaculum maritimum]CAA0156639.1 conserved hypothetical protein [Tenacibaculum maritimum]CAA0169923.1 conserved hypothetical protein [Tenacibaculum maritimum]CAA0238732.1 conserved hypothetical protein [Tenacibaculum maritimum]